MVTESEKELETSRAKFFELLKQFGAGKKDSIWNSYLEDNTEEKEGLIHLLDVYTNFSALFLLF